MTNQKKQRKRRENRAADPFGGPPRNRNTVSLTVALAALAILLVIQWSGGDIGALLNGSATLPTVAAPAKTRQATPTLQANEQATEQTNNDAPAAQVTATQQPTEASTATTSTQVRGVQTPRATVQPTPTANAPPVARASDLPTVAYDELPPEAHDTIALIEQDGPFPFSRDGLTFQNRERLLPLHPQGYYREYTVITPGERTRGARRIVSGEAGEMYYTADHYESFREIVR